MGLPDLVRSLIAGPVQSIAGPFRMTIQHIVLSGTGTYGPTYAAPVNAEAVVTNTPEVVTSQNGTERVASSKLQFLEQYPIKEGDRVTINGVTSTVIKVGSELDENGQPYAPVAWTGKM
jgi:hypothetical protein